MRACGLLGCTFEGGRARYLIARGFAWADEKTKLLPMPRAQLLTFPISHFCERARWALDDAGIDYVEKKVLQMFHTRELQKMGAGATVPALVYGDLILSDSLDILEWVDGKRVRGTSLCPWNKSAAERLWMIELSRNFAADTRRVAYDWLLPHKNLLLKYNNRGAPWWQGLALRIGYDKAVHIVRKHLGIHEATVSAAREAIQARLRWVESRLASRPYLSLEGSTEHDGQRYTALDLTFAAYFAPLCAVEGYGADGKGLPSLNELPPEIAERAAKYRERPAGRFVLRVYKEHRRIAGASKAGE